MRLITIGICCGVQRLNSWAPIVGPRSSVRKWRPLSYFVRVQLPPVGCGDSITWLMNSSLKSHLRACVWIRIQVNSARSQEVVFLWNTNPPAYRVFIAQLKAQFECVSGRVRTMDATPNRVPCTSFWNYFGNDRPGADDDCRHEYSPSVSHHLPADGATLVTIAEFQRTKEGLRIFKWKV